MPHHFKAASSIMRQLLLLDAPKDRLFTFLQFYIKIAVIQFLGSIEFLCRCGLKCFSFLMLMKTGKGVK